MPRATSSQRVMPPKMLKKIDLTWGSRVITSSASTTPSAEPPPPRSQKFAGLPPTCATTSTVDIESPAPLPQMPTSPSSFTYVTPFSRANASIGIGRARVAPLGDVRMPEERAVVDRELRVERLHLAVGRDDQRVDLAEHRVELDEGPVELLDDRRDLLLLGGILDAGAVDEPPRDPGLVALERVDVQADERVGALLGDLLDLDAALRREHEERLLRAAVERDREVVLLRDVGRALDPEAAHDVAVDVEAENVLRLLLGVVGALRELHAAGLAAAARQHLRLDDDGAAELLRRSARLLRRVGTAAVGDGNADALKSSLPWYS